MKYYEEYIYNGNDLGANYSKECTIFKVWSPPSQNVKLVIYDNYDDTTGKEYIMNKQENGIWEFKLYGDYKNKYYTYKVTIGELEKETVDPYTKGSTANGQKGMIVDFKSINPKGWENHRLPNPISQAQVIIYETHIRDFTVGNVDIKNKGKYLAFTESAALDYLKELGVTHIHILPIFDFGSVDETKDEYNWGYDPHLYNVPEGSYSTNPYDGTVRIKELKEMIKSLHENDIRVIMDVVYNHTYKVETSPFDILVPKYYYRINDDGKYSNGSGCGNEIGTEKEMVRKFIIDSLKFWVNEYKIDGFRFDLMGIMDIYTMKEIEKELRTIKSDILIYGEPWAGGESILSPHLMFTKGKQRGSNIAVFNDDFRNAIKGDNDGYGLGFINGGRWLESEVKKGIVGNIFYSNDINGFCDNPIETINYVSCHDNLTLFDKIKKTSSDTTEYEIEKMNRLALSIILTSYGIPFIHGGSEILKSKRGHHNSYNLGDEINKINWNDKYKYKETFEYIKGLIRFRKSQRVMNLENKDDIRKYLTFIDCPESCVGYLITSPYKEDYKNILIVHNANRREVKIQLPMSDNWKIIGNEYEVNLDGIYKRSKRFNNISIPALSTYILCKK
ncbi:type I pullulanase [Alkalithermobacter paradoxus]|uniref:Pullulanase n=1 Tax=Alkalithermobacter paradoxus TaxID=29349 RepID=A0A1V4IAW9_9FIRM|nr:pullulanase precursor [[Clostridium] thermoalcaliphilum]